MKEFQSKTAKHSLEKETTMVMNTDPTTALTTVPTTAQTTALTMAQTMALTMALTMAPTGMKVMKETIGLAQNGKNNQVTADLKEKMNQRKMKVM